MTDNTALTCTTILATVALVVAVAVAFAGAVVGGAIRASRTRWLVIPDRGIVVPADTDLPGLRRALDALRPPPGEDPPPGPHIPQQR